MNDRVRYRKPSDSVMQQSEIQEAIGRGWLADDGSEIHEDDDDEYPPDLTHDLGLRRDGT